MKLFTIIQTKFYRISLFFLLKSPEFIKIFIRVWNLLLLSPIFDRQFFTYHTITNCNYTENESLLTQTTYSSFLLYSRFLGKCFLRIKNTIVPHLLTLFLSFLFFSHFFFFFVFLFLFCLFSFLFSLSLFYCLLLRYCTKSLVIGLISKDSHPGISKQNMVDPIT